MDRKRKRNQVVRDEDLLKVFFDSDDELSDFSVSTDEFDPNDRDLSDSSGKFIEDEL